MEDAVRPDEQAFKAIYERGYRTWSSLHKTLTDVDANSPCLWSCCFDTLEHYPLFPKHPALNTSSSNTILAVGISTWKSANRACDLPPFEQEFSIPVASERPTIITIADPDPSSFVYSRFSGGNNDHITVLVLAWSYILSARWAEIIPGVSGPKYNNFEAAWDNSSIVYERNSADSTSNNIELGDVSSDAARWWAAVLAMEGGWDAFIPGDKGHIFHSPWYFKVKSEQRFTLSSCTKSRPSSSQHHTASFATALRYVSDYCEYHQVNDQSHAALAATLLLPVAKYDNRMIQLPMPRVSHPSLRHEKNSCKTSAWSRNLDQLDKLLALSCNALGAKALLTSVFFEPGLECNVCGAWLQGSFAFLDSEIAKDQNILLRTLMARDPSLGFLWLGAFIIGAHKRSLQEARQAWWKIDLQAAAWTGTQMSFIQEPVLPLSPEVEEISRADECRLMYLCHDQSYTTPPLFPFAPFGFTAMTDVNIDVRQHARCAAGHELKYNTLTWLCPDGQDIVTPFPDIPFRAKKGQPMDDNISVNYDDLDYEDDDCSEMVTRNIFTWLRDDDGFPIAERAIREHEWIDNLDSDDDSLITGSAQSTAGGNLHGWLLKTTTKRSNSL